LVESIVSREWEKYLLKKKIDETLHTPEWRLCASVALHDPGVLSLLFMAWLGYRLPDRRTGARSRDINVNLVVETLWINRPFHCFCPRFFAFPSPLARHQFCQIRDILVQTPIRSALISDPTVKNFEIRAS
jgi:hypothetical protein